MSILTLFGKTVVAGPGKVLTNRFIEIHDKSILRISNFGRKPDISADVIFPGFIDPHVHCRDWKQSYKETFSTAGAAAAHGGITRFHEMPNTDPPVLHKEEIEKRIDDYKKSGSPVEYGLYAGLTADRTQIKEAVDAVKTYPEVMGLKLFAGDSVGSFAVCGPDEQMDVYRTLTESGYRGPLMIHAEKVSEFSTEPWSVNNPESWSDIRPPSAETDSVKEQIRFAIKAGFRGKMHICHATLPETVELAGTLKVSFGVTPHHTLLSYESMQQRSRGLYYKVNPPLRRRKSAAGLMSHLLRGDISWIETDHAPHTLDEKLNAPYYSGMPELDNFSNYIAWLRKTHGMPLDDIVRLTSFNSAKFFGLGDREIKSGNAAILTLMDMKDETVERSTLKTKCGWSPYEGMRFPGRCKATIINGKLAYLAKS